MLSRRSQATTEAVQNVEVKFDELGWTMVRKKKKRKKKRKGNASNSNLDEGSKLQVDFLAQK